MPVRPPRLEQTNGQEPMTNRVQRTLDTMHSDISSSLEGLTAADIGYTPTTPGDWVAPAPTTLQEATDRLAAAGGVTPVP